MKRTVPLLITALVGLILIASRFIPPAQSWGEVAAIWFDVLAAVAFVLGGGSLFKLQLKKISDRAAGWGYSAITLVAFAAMLFAGLSKWGAPPAAQQEFYGQSFARLGVSDLPDGTVVRMAGEIPARPYGEGLPLSVKRQLSQKGGQLVFRGWMTPRQQAELSDYEPTLAWQCTVERLFNATQPKPPLKGKIEYLADHSSLSFRGFMNDDVHNALVALGGNEHWNEAVETLWKKGRRVEKVPAAHLPPGYTIPATMKDFVFYDTTEKMLGIRGPMSRSIRDALARGGFLPVHPMNDMARNKFRSELESLGGPLNPDQIKAFETTLGKNWVVSKLRVALDEAGKAVEVEKTACEMAAARQAAQNGGKEPAPDATKSGHDQILNDKQRAELDRFAADPAMTVDALAERLRAQGPFNDRQVQALEAFFERVPTIGEQRLDLCVKLLREGSISRKQRDFLLKDYREQHRWESTVGRLFVAAHITKYPWSGPYNSAGSVFGWAYEFIFKPLQATMFSLLAFYVASAAFRAFRAKNLQAILLLGTAFIILLGQTFAGHWLTSWIPDSSPLAPLKIKNLTELVAVFLTAGSRAIMIGIALGVASTSLKVLLGIDRSYLGTGE